MDIVLTAAIVVGVSWVWVLVSWDNIMAEAAAVVTGWDTLPDSHMGEKEREEEKGSDL